MKIFAIPMSPITCRAEAMAFLAWLAEQLKGGFHPEDDIRDMVTGVGINSKPSLEADVAHFAELRRQECFDYTENICGDLKTLELLIGYEHAIEMKKERDLDEALEARLKKEQEES